MAVYVSSNADQRLHDHERARVKGDLSAFLSLLAEEDFRKGRRWAWEQVRSLSSRMRNANEHYNALHHCENEPNFSVPRQLIEEAPAELAFLMFGATYFAARFKIEQSYLYQHAHKLIDLSLEFLDRAGAGHSWPLLAAVRGLVEQQKHMSEIERCCYRSDISCMAEAGRQVTSAVARLRVLEAHMSAEDGDDYRRYLKKDLDGIDTYAQAICTLSGLLEHRWTDRRQFRQQWDAAIAGLEEARARLIQLGASIHTNDLVPQIETIVALSKIDDAIVPGELELDAGKIEIAYYAMTDTELARQLDAYLRGRLLAVDRMGGGFLSTLDALSFGTVEDDAWSDIWAGPDAQQIVDSLSWEMHDPVTVTFRGQPVEFDVSLRFYNFGLFALTFTADASALSVSAVRHLMALGSPIGLDEKIEGKGPIGKFGTFEQIAHRLVFPALEHALKADRVLAYNGARPLFYNANMNRFVALRADRLALRAGGMSYPTLWHRAAGHPAFKGLFIETLEVRAAVDDWIMRPMPDDSLNLARLRYYEAGDYLYVRRHEGVICLLNQGNWAREQAWECLVVNAAIANYFCLSCSYLEDEVKGLVDEVSDARSARRSTGAASKRTRRRLEESLRSLVLFERKVEGILSSMMAGRIMRFPDLTHLANAMTRNMGLADLGAKAHNLLDHCRSLQERMIEQSARAEEVLRRRTTENITILLAFIALFELTTPLLDFLEWLQLPDHQYWGYCLVGSLIAAGLVWFAARRKQSYAA